MTEEQLLEAVRSSKSISPRRLHTHIVLHPEDLMSYLLGQRRVLLEMMPQLSPFRFPTLEKELNSTSTRLVYQGVTVITDSAVPRGEAHVI